MINCVLLDAEDSKEGWAKVLHDTLLSLTNGCGVGIDYGKIRPYGSEIKGSGGTASGAVSLMRVLNGVAKPISQGNTLRSALLASLPWWHGDIFEFIQEKVWHEDIVHMKAKNIEYPAPLDFTNCSVRLDSDFLAALDRGDAHATKVWEALTYAMFSTGEPGITFNLDDQIFRNACGEIISNHPNDVCVLASINLDKMQNLDMVVDNVNFAMHALIQTLRHTVYPTRETESTSKQYPRVGLGYMGLHNWLIARGERYGWNSSLQQLMKTFKEASHYYGDLWAHHYGINSLCGYNAIAPTG
jgi:ribonucleoside-diphosphate reductase alpha chain